MHTASSSPLAKCKFVLEIRVLDLNGDIAQSIQYF